MSTEEKKISRVLRKDNGETLDAEELLEKKYADTFERDGMERVNVIDIHTAYNDYKKLHDDLLEVAKAWDKKIICLSGNTNIWDIVKKRELRKVCKKEKLLVGDGLLNILSICDILIGLLTICWNIYTHMFTEDIFYSLHVLVPVLLLCSFSVVSILLVLLTERYNNKIREKLEELDEDCLIKLYSHLGQRGSLLEDNSIYFIENFSRLDRNCRSYLIAYLSHIQYMTQMWCVFDYLFEDLKKISVIKGNNVHCECYKLEPLKYEKKEDYYKKYNLQREIDKEYLNCIGVDILFGYRGDDFHGVKFDSWDYIAAKIKQIKTRFDVDGGLTGIFFCLVYMSSKYKYSFSLDQIVSLIQNEEEAKVKQDLYNLITDAANRILNGRAKNKNDIQRYFGKIIDILDGYYFTEERREGGRKVKKYKFSYDILECFQQRMIDFYPDEATVNRWILVKLIGNIEMFRVDRYFFDCSNLLVLSDFLEDREFCILSSRLMIMMNGSNCWTYYSPILRRLRDMDAGIIKKYWSAEAVKRAAINNLFYRSDEQSMEYGIHFLVSLEGGSIRVDDFAFDTLSPWMAKMEKYSSALTAYFKLLYQTFDIVIARFYKFGKEYKDIVIKPFDEQDYLPSICHELILFSIICFSGVKSKIIFDNYNRLIATQLEKIQTGEEAKVFKAIVEEMLLWIDSILCEKRDKEERNINVGMLIETSNSNMLYFIYGLLNMVMVGDSEFVFKCRNTLLNFIGQSVFYFRVVTQGKGITKYVNDLIRGCQSDNLKMNMSLELLAMPNPCQEILRNYIVENMDVAESLIIGHLKSLDSARSIESYISILFMYNINLNNKKFTERVFGEVFQYLSQLQQFEDGMLEKQLKVVLEEECPDEEYMDIVDEINQIDERTFAIWVLHGYCQAKEAMIERIPQIDLRILAIQKNNIGLSLMAKYLLRHSYYDCDAKILNLYLQKMRNIKFPSKWDIEKYLWILDNYAVDNANIKKNEISTYNALLSLHFYYLSVEMAEKQEAGGDLTPRTLEFMFQLFRCLLQSGMDFDTKNETICTLGMEDGTLKRNQMYEESIARKFLSLNPVVDMKEGRCLSKEYFEMIVYMRYFPDIYSRMQEHAKNGQEIINYKHILYLIDILLDRTQNSSHGFNRESLQHAKEILEGVYSIRY